MMKFRSSLSRLRPLDKVVRTDLIIVNKWLKNLKTSGKIVRLPFSWLQNTYLKKILLKPIVIQLKKLIF